MTTTEQIYARGLTQRALSALEETKRLEKQQYAELLKLKFITPEEAAAQNLSESTFKSYERAVPAVFQLGLQKRQQLYEVTKMNAALNKIGAPMTELEPQGVNLGPRGKRERAATQAKNPAENAKASADAARAKLGNGGNNSNDAARKLMIDTTRKA